MAVFGVASFIQSAKGSVAVNVDLGGETPKAVILLTNGHISSNDAAAAGTDGTIATRLFNDVNIWFGVGSGSGNNENIRTNTNDNDSVHTSSRLHSDNRIARTGGTFSQDWEVDFTSFGADTVTINFANAPIALSGIDRRFTLIAFGGSDCEVHLNRQNLGTGTSAIDVTAPGFEPDVVFAMSALVTAVASSANPAYHSFGIAVNDGSDTQRSFGRGEGASAVSVSRPAQVIHDGRILTTLNAAVNPSTLGEGVIIEDFDANGYSVRPTASWSSRLGTFLAIKAPGLDFHLDDYLTKNTTTGVQSYTGAGFAPAGAIIVGGGPTTINTPINWVEDAATNYMSIVEDPNDTAKVGVYAHRNRNNVDPSQSASLSKFDGHVIYLGDADFTGLEVGLFDQFTADGFDIDFTTVDNTSHIFFALLIGDGSAPASAYASRRFFMS